MLRRFAAAVCAAALLTGCGAPGYSTDAGTGYVAADGAIVLRDAADRGEALDIEGTLLDGSAWSLAAARGKVLLLNAWGPWCAPCRTEVPQLQTLQADLGAEGLQVVGFATRTNRTAVDAFTRKYDIDYPQVQDYDSAHFLGIRGVPSMSIPGTLIIDRRGRIAGWAIGAVDVSLLRGFAETLLKEAA